MTGVGVARVLLLDPVVTSGQPRFYAAFDSGMIQESPGGRRFNAGIGRVNSLALSADRRTIYVGGFDGRVRAINVATNQVHDVLVTGGSVNAVALNAAESRLVAVNDEGRLILVEPRTGQATGDVKLSASALTAVALSHDGRTALAGDANGCCIK